MIKNSKLLFVALLCLVVGILLLVIMKLGRNKEYLPGKYVGDIVEDMLLIADDNKYGYYDVKARKLKVGLNYELPYYIKESNKTNLEALNYGYGFIKIVDENNLYGLMDIDENVLIKPKYSSLDIYGENIILVCDRDFFFINSKGERISNKNYSFIEEVGSNLFKAKIDEKYEIITGDMRSLFNNQYEQINCYGDGSGYIFELKNGDEYAYYFYSGNKLEKLSMQVKINITNYSNKVITYYKESGHFYNYNIVTQNEVYLGNYISVGEYSNGLAFVINGNKTGYIDYEGNVIIPFIFESGILANFTEYNLASVYANDYFKIIDNNGNVIIDGYEIADIINDKRFVVGHKLVNMIDNKLKKISKEYKEIRKIKGNDKYLITVDRTSHGPRYGLINYDGKEIERCKYINIKVYGNYAIFEEKENCYMLRELS